MMSNQCNLIKDILPLYMEDMVSSDTREFVEEHLEHCAECHAEYKHMKKTTEVMPDIDNIAPLKKIRKKLFVKRMQTIFFTATLVCAIVIAAFAVLASPDFFPYSESLVNITDSPDGNITVAFDNKVTGYSCTKEFDEETDTEVYRISAWNTTWDLYLFHRGKQNVILSPNMKKNIRIFYAQNDGSEDVLIYGENGSDYEGVTTLPRLILMPCFLLAFLAFVILAIVRFLVKRREDIIVWVDRAILLPISYMAAHLCTKGINFKTYSSQRDFCIIILVAIFVYCAMLTGIALYKAKKEKFETGKMV